jgi:hypothetical protein
MKTKLATTIMILSLLTGFFAFAATTRQVSADNEHVNLYITPPETTKNPPGVDSFFDVYLDISGVTDLFGFDIKVTWDNTLITRDDPISNATTKTILAGLWSGGWFPAKEESSGGGGGGGYYRLAAISMSAGYTGTHSLFNIHFKIIKECNFLLQTTIHIEAGYKLSNSTWQSIPVETVTDGVFKMNPTTPDLELEYVDLTPSKPFEYCKTFYVKVYVSHICAQLKDYIIHISYTSELLKFTGVSEWGVLGDTSNGASVIDDNVNGEVQVQDTGGLVYTGDKGLLFTLAFHVEFDDRDTHIWREGHPQSLPVQISIQIHIGLELSFVEGVWPISLVQLVNNPISKSVGLIRGDVGPVDGEVTVFDLRTVAAFYDLSQPAKYDITNDGTIDIFDLVAVATNIGYGSL